MGEEKKGSEIDIRITMPTKGIVIDITDKKLGIAELKKELDDIIEKVKELMEVK